MPQSVNVDRASPFVAFRDTGRNQVAVENANQHLRHREQRRIEPSSVEQSCGTSPIPMAPTAQSAPRREGLLIQKEDQQPVVEAIAFHRADCHTSSSEAVLASQIGIVISPTIASRTSPVDWKNKSVSVLPERLSAAESFVTVEALSLMRPLAPPLPFRR